MKENKYICVFFPFPSGDSLHIGHWYNYAIVDSYCKLQKYLGNDVYQPFGMDSHGLPTENYAKKMGMEPKIAAEQNIKSFMIEMERMDTSYEYKFSTHDSKYIERTQWLFNKLLEHDLAYKAFRSEPFCPSCETTLAREQVKSERCERCGTDVIKKEMYQWFFKITDYAQRLLDDLDKVDYPEKTKKQQREWIGRSEGYEVDFGGDVVCFTTKPETLLDVKFIATPIDSSPYHEKDGKERLIGKIIHPITKHGIPIYTSNYVVEGYGTGYVMGVPNDDKRDRDFAIRNDIPFSDEKQIIDIDMTEFPFVKKKINYRLNDWCVSRQRSWGCPIPIDGETDTLDTFVDSSFYTIEYDKTHPVDLYVGGNEHACMHLIYARFITKFLFDIGYITFDEPFKRLIHQGMILGPDGNKMSKSLGNTISPLKYDPQLLRMYLMFINHYFEGGKWQDNGYKGCDKFRNRFNTWISNTNSEGMKDFDRIFDEFKKKVINYFEIWKTNKVVSEWMIFYNSHKNFNLSKEQSLQLLEFFNVCF